jgi:hypothetical protein
MSKRECGTCTKCCEGWLTTNVLGHSLYPGQPCHFVSINQGCTNYAKRPSNPCALYKCDWLKNEYIPEWMKPDKINAIIDTREINGIPYIALFEAGATLDPRVLTWMIKHVMSTGQNFYWQVNSGENWIGSKEFLETMQKPDPK